MCSILGGFGIALAGSLAFPDKTFKWAMLNDRIPLVDDVAPPRDEETESDAKLSFQVKIAIGASVVLSIVLIILWPLPMHLGAGVFSEAGFTAWVVLKMLWAIIGGIVIIVLPGYELLRTFLGKDAPTKSGDSPLGLKIQKQQVDATKSNGQQKGDAMAELVPQEVAQC